MGICRNGRLPLAGILSVLALVWSGCGGKESPREDGREPEQAPVPAVLPLDGAGILERARRITDLGPRIPGTAGHRRMPEFIAGELRDGGIPPGRIRRDGWSQLVPSPAGPLESVPMMNLVATIPGAGERAIAVAAHYDTPRVHGAVGANTSAAPVALLVELARHFAADDRGGLRSTLHFVFLDAEEAIGEWDDGHHSFGGKRLCADASFRCDAFVKVGSLGAGELHIADDMNSSPALKRLVEAAGRAVLGRGPFGQSFEVLSDHLVFAGRGIPAVALYDAEFPNAPWFVNPTLDVPALLDPETLGRAGALLADLIRRIDRSLGN